MSISRTRVVAAAGAAIAVAFASAAVAGTNLPSAATAGCAVNYSTTAQWAGGFGANVTINNLGDPVNGWTLVWSFGAGQAITQLWNGCYTQSVAPVTVTSSG